MQLDARDRKALRAFLMEHIGRIRSNSSLEFYGLASGNLLGLLQVVNRPLFRKVKDRQGLVAAADGLGFVNNPRMGGGRRGAVVWEYIDLPQAAHLVRGN
jgi:hypothetical protein